jgi:hypothetical protein
MLRNLGIDGIDCSAYHEFGRREVCPKRDMMRKRVFLVSIGVCLLVGVPVGTVVFGVLSGAPWLVFSRDIAGVPFLVYGFISGGPVALVAGMLGGATLLALIGSKNWNPTRLGWALTCAGLGVFVAISLGLALSIAGWAEEERLFLMVAFFGLTGGSCGALLGLYGWSVKRTGAHQRR